VCGRRQGAEKRDQVDFYLMRGRGNIHPTDDYVIEHVMLANTLQCLVTASHDCSRLEKKPSS
jgi:hypothetical protein